MFRFKQFTIRQDRCPMKVGTDGVLLGAWADVPPEAERVLDIGTGTGLIALMLAQRTAVFPHQVHITGVDVDDVTEARENAAASPWGDRVMFCRCPVQEFRPAERFDVIVSNPPYFVDSLTCPDAGRTTARHAVTLSYEALCEAVVRLLAPGGRFAVILPTAEAERFCAVCRGRLVLCRRTDVRTTPRRAPKRVLMEFSAAETDGGDNAGASVSGEDNACPASAAFACSVPTAVSAAPASPASAVPARPVPARPAPAATTCPASARPVPASPVPASPASARLAPACPASAAAPALVAAFAPICSELVIGTGEHEQYTAEYRALTRDFYLKF